MVTNGGQIRLQIRINDGFRVCQMPLLDYEFQRLSGGQRPEVVILNPHRALEYMMRAVLVQFFPFII